MPDQSCIIQAVIPDGEPRACGPKPFAGHGLRGSIQSSEADFGADAADGRPHSEDRQAARSNGDSEEES